MTYGCIGEHLPHSFSREIHRRIGGYPYELIELAPDEVDAFLAERAFSAVNVTIPYKEAVMKGLDSVSVQARAVGCVNTIVNRGGKLYGYNTDFDGLRMLIGHIGADPAGKKVLILGTGGTSKTAESVVRAKIHRNERHQCHWKCASAQPAHHSGDLPAAVRSRRVRGGSASAPRISRKRARPSSRPESPATTDGSPRPKRAIVGLVA